MIVNLMRANQRWMMTAIAILVIVSFIWFFSDRGHYERGGNDQVASVYGRSLSNIDFERTIRQLRTASDLGLSNLMQQDSFSQRDLGASAMNFIVLKHQASELGIEPTDAEVEEASRHIPAFQAPGGGFDSIRYAEFVDKKLGPRGFSDRQVDELVRADLQIGKLRQVVDSASMVSPAEVRLAYEQAFARSEVSVIRLKKADFAAAVSPTEDEIKKYYDEQKDHFQFPEKRKVQYVVFGLDEAGSKLNGKERVDAMKPKAEAAEKFIEQAIDGKGKADFAKLAADAGVPVKETPEFEENQAGGMPEATIPRFVETAFHLSAQQPDSDVIDTPTAYYLLHLSGVTPAKPMTVEEAKPKIVQSIKDERAQVALAARAEEARTKVEAALKTGKSIGDAAHEAGLAAEDVPGFSAAEPASGFADASQVTEASMELNANELSKLVPTPDGGALVYVRNRQGIDEGKFNTQKEMIANSIRARKRRFGFMEWLRASRDAADIRFAQGAGAVEGS